MARTPKARALGSALRQAREEQGLTLRAFAKSINRDIGQMSRWETGQKAPKPEQVAQILTALGVNGDRFEEILRLSYGTNEPLWVATLLPENRQQLAALLDCEQNATKIIEVSPLLVPGLLQTSEYVRAIMVDADVPASELATRVAVRIGRSDILKRKPHPVELVALIGEGALKQVIRSRSILIDQLRNLLDLAHWSNIDLPNGKLI